LVATTVCLSFSQADSDEADGGSVKIKRAVAVRVAPDKDALSIDYEYRFDGRNAVHIAGLGDVPAEGSFKYVTEANSLVFSDALSGKTLRR